MAATGERAVPVTVIGGFLGAGKTTLVNHILRSWPERRIGVLVNDFGDIDIDGRLIVGSTQETLRLANGCVCCTIRDDLVEAISRLVFQPEPPQHIVVETSGVSDPVPVLQTFQSLSEDGLVTLDGAVIVADAEALPDLDRRAARLAARQLRTGDLVVLNKIDLVHDRLERVERRLRRLAPRARVVRAERAAVPLEILLGERERRAAPPPSEGEAPHPGFETRSVVMDQPMTLSELRAAIEALPTSVYRAKGFVHLAGRPERRTLVHLVGRRVSLSPGATWGADPRRTELVMIGTDLPSPESLVATFEPRPAPPPEAPLLERALTWLRGGS